MLTKEINNCIGYILLWSEWGKKTSHWGVWGGVGGGGLGGGGLGGETLPFT